VNRAFKEHHLLAFLCKIDSLVLRNNVIRSKLELEISISLLSKLNFLSVFGIFTRVHSFLLFKFFNLLLAKLSLEFTFLSLLLTLGLVLSLTGLRHLFTGDAFRINGAGLGLGGLFSLLVFL